MGEEYLVLLYYFLVLTGIYILMGWSFYLTYRVGHLYFLSISIMAICAYFAGIASREWHWPFLLTMAVSMFIGYILSHGISLLIADAPGFTVVIVGLTSMFIVKTVIENWGWLGGSMGFFNIPSVRYLILWTYLLLMIVGFILFSIEDSQITREANVLFDDKNLAASLGIQSKKVGQFFHSFAGILAGLSGVLYALLIGGLTIDFFGFGMVGTLMSILFVGGYKSMWGVVLAAPLLGGIPILLPDTFVAWKQAIYGFLLITVICLRPEGLITRKEIFYLKGQLRKKR